MGYLLYTAVFVFLVLSTGTFSFHTVLGFEPKANPLKPPT
jgi:hypothetical protein